jgi:hypothetical protein
MGEEYMCMSMERNMMESGMTTCSMDRALRHGQMGHDSKEYTSREEKKVMEHTTGQMEVDTQGTGTTIKYREG